MKSSERLTKRTVDAAQPAAKSYRVWDGELRGFGLKVTPKGIKTYIATYRVGTGRSAPQREYTLGRHGVLTPDEAREEARRVLSSARLGADPQGDRQRKRGEMTIAQLCDLYLEEGTGQKKPSTLATDRGRIAKHIKPLLGKMAVSAVTDDDIKRFMRAVANGKTASGPVKVGTRAVSHVRGGKGTASRTVGLLGGIFSFAKEHRMRPDNPVKGVKRYEDGKSRRYLSPAELARLGKAIAAEEAAGGNARGLAVVRLLTFTGARKSEIEGLRWEEVDIEDSSLRLRDSKTGAKVIQLGAPSLAVLNARASRAKDEQAKAEEQAKAKGRPIAAPSPWVFPASRGSDGHWCGTPKLWGKLREAAGLSDVRLHDLRHTFASSAIAGGQPLAVIGALLGHKDVKTTARYAHLAEDHLKQAVDKVSEATAAAMAGKSADVIPLNQAAQRNGLR